MRGQNYDVQGAQGENKKQKRCGRSCIVSLILVFFFVTIAIAIFLVILYVGPKSKVLVVMPDGSVRGRIVDSPQGDRVQEFLGIPYAKPPVGQLRYADPQPYGRITEDPYEADSYRQSCHQILDTTFGDFPGSDMWNAKNPLSEDCLYLNIWAPETTDAQSQKSVMVWIYGGGFYGGSSQLWVYDGKALAAYGDVIVVSMNYRVGSFGFLSTGDGRIKGNFGLKDQQLALLWIQQNIEYFGGDPESVTLFGESAGGASIGYHTLNPTSAATFHRAIYQSGSVDSHWSYLTQETMRERSEILINAVGCPNNDNILQCLREKPWEEIFNNEWVTSEFLAFPWAPNIDGDFLLDSPHNLLKSGAFAKKPSIIGSNLDEGTFWILYVLPGFNHDGPSLQNFTTYLEGVETICWDLNSTELSTIQQLYAPTDRLNPEENRDALDDVSGDRAFTCPVISLADTLSQDAYPTYYYYLTHRASNEVWPDWMGVIHGADIQWVFGMPLNASRGYSAAEMEFSRALMDYWVNFAKTGNPNGESLSSWPQYLPERREYLEFSAPNNFIVGNNLKSETCPTWDAIHAERNT